jgi:hypothetical protein
MSDHIPRKDATLPPTIGEAKLMARIEELERKLDRLVRASTKVHDSHWYSPDGIIEGMFDLGEALRLAQLKGEDRG